jgi:putative PIN family toxin of toxin-antitoxin system
MLVVLDTNVLVSALRSGGGTSRRVLRLAFERGIEPVFGNALWSEYEDLIERDIWDGLTTLDERKSVLAALAGIGRWVKIHYAWRPNLRDEGDNHLIELAVAGGCEAIVTHNWRDLDRGELRWANLAILTPAQLLERME